MKYRLVVLLLALTLLMGIPAAFTAFAEETVILPSWVYDFTNSGITAHIGGGIHNLTYLVHDSSHKIGRAPIFILYLHPDAVVLFRF